MSPSAEWICLLWTLLALLGHNVNLLCPLNCHALIFDVWFPSVWFRQGAYASIMEYVHRFCPLLFLVHPAILYSFPAKSLSFLCLVSKQQHLPGLNHYSGYVWSHMWFSYLDLQRAVPLNSSIEAALDFRPFREAGCKVQFVFCNFLMEVMQRLLLNCDEHSKACPDLIIWMVWWDAFAKNNSASR